MGKAKTAVMAVTIAVLGAGAAPFQCASDPNHAREDSPPEVLFDLAERFYAEGHPEAGRETLEYLIERYPQSRYRIRAEERLSEANSQGTGRVRTNAEH